MPLAKLSAGGPILVASDTDQWAAKHEDLISRRA